MVDFIRKLFKALNSSAKSWQLSGAVVLAMFAGFLPAPASLLSLVILFLALIFNINFGLFILFSALFAALGYLFDPLFESLGYALLTLDALKEFFTSLYNSALFRWTSFNYTLVTGSLVVSALLALPLFFILNKVIALYRVQIGVKLNEWKATRWMKLYNEEAKSGSVFRWWGAGVFGGLSVGVVLVSVFLFDPFVRIALERSLSYSLQTQVEIKEFHSDFSDLRIKISDIQIADKEKLTHNLVTLGTMEFDLSFAALMEKKAMIELLNVDALAFNTKRAVAAKPYGDGDSSDTKETKTDDSQTKASSKDATPFSIPDVDSILEKEELKSVTEAQKLKADIEKTKEKWAKISDELKNSNEVDTIKNDAQKLQNNLKNADLAKLASAKSDIDSLKAKIDSLKNKYTSLQKDFNADQERITRQINALKDLPQQDIARLKTKYSLNAAGGANLIGTIMGDEIGGYIHTALKYYDMIAPYIRSDAKQEEVTKSSPPRGEGRWVHYANLSTLPDLVVKKAKINVKLTNDVLNLTIDDLSSDQKLYQKPMKLHADAQGTQYAQIVANVIDDRRGATAKTEFDLKMTALRTNRLDIQTLHMNDIITNATAEGTLTNGSIKATSRFNVTDVKLSMPSQKFVNDLLTGITKFNVDISAKGSLEQPVLDVRSDLDKQLSKGMETMIAKAMSGFEKDLKAKILAKAGGSSEGLSSDLGDIDSLLNSKQDALGGINTNFAPSSGGGLKLPVKLF